MKYTPTLTIAFRLSLIMALVILLSACGEDPLPKPKGYFRIDLPQREYLKYTSTCPLEFDVPKYARVEVNRNEINTDTCLFNVSFPAFKAKLHLTYLPISDNRDQLIRDAYGFAAKHEMKATAIRRTLVEDYNRSVFGVVYDIEGEAASPMQFFLMDSTSHFLRGALYFNHRPNPDSIAPVLEFIREDVMQLSKSLVWTN